MTVLNKPHTFSPSTTISSSEVNANFDTIYNDYNGSIAAANLASNAVTTAKIADANVTTAKIADLNVTTAKIADAAVTAPKIGFGGAGVGIWWEEIGRTTLGSAGDTITVSSLPARKYLKLLIDVTGTGGTASINTTFNGDTGSNYAKRQSSDGGADATTTSAATILMTGASANSQLASVEITNVANREKLLIYHVFEQGTAGAANIGTRRETVAKWANTSDAISSITVTNTGTGDYAIGSEVIVLGHN